MGDAVGTDWLVALVGVVAAARTLLFDVGHLAAAADITVSARDATAREGPETEKANEAHSIPASGIAIDVPDEQR